MGNRNSQDVLPYIPLFFPNDEEQDMPETRIVSSSLEYTILRTLLNLEKIKELLNLKDTIEDPLGRHKGSGFKCLNTLKDLSELKESPAEVFNQNQLEDLAAKVKAIASEVSQTDPMLKILTLTHFSISCLSLLNEDKNAEKKSVGKTIKDLLSIMNWTDLSEFDREIVANYLYSDLFSVGLEALEEQAASQRFLQVKGFLETNSLDIFNSLEKTPNFYRRVIQPFLFSADSMPVDSEFEPIAASYKQLVFKQVCQKDFSLSLCAPAILSLNSCTVKYFGLSHNVTFGTITPTNNISVEVKNIKVQVYFGVENPFSVLFSYVASVKFQDALGNLLGAPDFEKLHSTVGDLVNRVAELRPTHNNDYKTDFGFAVVTEQNDWFYYTTNKELQLHKLLEGSEQATPRVYFFPVKNSLVYNQPGINNAVFVIKNQNQHGLFVESVEQPIDSLLGEISKSTGYGFEHLNNLELFSDQTYSNQELEERQGLPVDAKSKLGSLKSMTALSSSNAAKKTSDPKPVDFVLVGPKTVPQNLELHWGTHSESKYKLKIDPGKFFSTLLKNGVDWKSMKKPTLERVVRTSLPNLLVLDYAFIRKYVDVPVRFTIEFMADLCSKQNLQVPTTYNLQAMIAKASAGYYYDIYRKSLENNVLVSFYESERKLADDTMYTPGFIQNHLDLQMQSNKLQDDMGPATSKEITRKTTSLDKINFSRIEYVIFQQTLSIR